MFVWKISMKCNGKWTRKPEHGIGWLDVVKDHANVIRQTKESQRMCLCHCAMLPVSSSSVMHVINNNNQGS